MDAVVAVATSEGIGGLDQGLFLRGPSQRVQRLGDQAGVRLPVARDDREAAARVDDASGGMVGVDELAEHVQAVFRLTHHMDGRSEVFPRRADALRPDLFLRPAPFVELFGISLLVGGDEHVDLGLGEAVLQGRFQQRLRVDHAGEPDGVDAGRQGGGHGDLEAVQVMVRKAVAG